MSEITSPRALKVLYSLHPSFEILDFAGPLEILSHATFSLPDGSSKQPVFKHTLAAVDEDTTSTQNVVVKRHISIEEAYANIADYDVLVIPGGGSDIVLERQIEPLSLIAAFATLPPRQDGGIRTILSVCTGSVILAEAGVLTGLTATTHPGYYQRLRDVGVRLEREGRKPITVVEERFVVNVVDEEKKLRIITSGGVSCGMDAALWFIEDVAGKESKERAGYMVQYQYRHGLVLRI